MKSSDLKNISRLYRHQSRHDDGAGLAIGYERRRYRPTRPKTSQTPPFPYRTSTSRVEIRLLCCGWPPVPSSPLLPFHQTKLLILRLAPPGPLWRHINTLVFLFVTLLLRLMYTCWLMLGRAIHGVENERRGPSVNKLMLCTRWYDYEIAGFDILVFAGYGSRKLGTEPSVLQMVLTLCLFRS